jgi:flagellar hook-length control protein FliK
MINQTYDAPRLQQEMNRLQTSRQRLAQVNVQLGRIQLRVNNMLKNARKHRLL